jgi:hypothetical protein
MSSIFQTTSAGLTFGMCISSSRLSFYHFISFIKNHYSYYFYPLFHVSSHLMILGLPSSSDSHQFHCTNRPIKDSISRSTRSNTIYRYFKNSLCELRTSFRQARAKKLFSHERDDPNFQCSSSKTFDSIPNSSQPTKTHYSFTRILINTSSRYPFHPSFIANLVSRNSEKTETFDIILDSGSTFSITSHKEDFATYTALPPETIHTVSGTASILGEGIAHWDIISEEGNLVQIQVHCKHVPAASTRLLSPQDYCQYHQLDRFQDQYGGNSDYFWLNVNRERQQFRCTIDSRTNLPIITAKAPSKRSCSLSSTSVLSNDNVNITPAQKELLLWHCRLGHLGFMHLQLLMTSKKSLESTSNPCASNSDNNNSSCIIPKNLSSIKCQPPLCAACQISRAK